MIGLVERSQEHAVLVEGLLRDLDEAFQQFGGALPILGPPRVGQQDRLEPPVGGRAAAQTADFHEDLGRLAEALLAPLFGECPNERAVCGDRLRPLFQNLAAIRLGLGRIVGDEELGRSFEHGDLPVRRTQLDRGQVEPGRLGPPADRFVELGQHEDLLCLGDVDAIGEPAEHGVGGRRVFLHARVEAEERDPHADVGGGQFDGPLVGQLRAVHRFAVIGRALRRREQDRLPQPHEAAGVVRFALDPILRQTQRLFRFTAADVDRDGDRGEPAGSGHRLADALELAIGLGEAALLDQAGRSTLPTGRCCGCPGGWLAGKRRSLRRPGSACGRAFPAGHTAAARTAANWRSRARGARPRGTGDRRARSIGPRAAARGRPATAFPRSPSIFFKLFSTASRAFQSRSSARIWASESRVCRLFGSCAADSSRRRRASARFPCRRSSSTSCVVTSDLPLSDSLGSAETRIFRESSSRPASMARRDSNRATVSGLAADFSRPARACLTPASSFRRSCITARACHNSHA